MQPRKIDCLNNPGTSGLSCFAFEPHEDELGTSAINGDREDFPNVYWQLRGVLCWADRSWWRESCLRNADVSQL